MSRTFAGSEVRIISFETCHVGPNAVRKLPDEGVVILNRVVVALAFNRDSVFCSGKFVLKTQEILIRTKLRIILDHREKTSEGTVELPVGGNFVRGARCR